MMRFLPSVFLLAAVQVCVSFASSEHPAKPNDFGVLEWIHNAEGGYFNPKQDFRYEIPGDPTSPIGIFAKERIDVGEVLLEVPWHKMLKGDDPTCDDALCCGLGIAVARELKKGEKSEYYAPYAMYLNAQNFNQLPSGWSETAKDLLREIVGGDVLDTLIPPVEPTEWLDVDWYKDCDGDPKDAISSKAALMVIQRGDGAFLPPAYDFYNHRNGKWLNTETSMVEDKHHITKASRMIEAGEQIYISYNMCKECEGRKDGYGTAGK